MKKSAFLLMLVLFLSTACTTHSNVCETDPPDQTIEERQSLSLEDLQGNFNGIPIKVKNQEVLVDQIVHGYLCNADWSGTIYVDCDVEVNSWEEAPAFFDGCDLNIEPGTVVYVAHHSDEAYFNGCSCHYSQGQ